MTDTPPDSDGGKSRRPAEAQLVDQLGDMRESLFDGFESRRAVLLWAQKLTVRTLGHVKTKRYRELAESFMPDSRFEEGPLLAALLTENARSRDLSEGAVEHIREDWAASTIATAQVAAFRALRASASEYIGRQDGDTHRDETPGHDPTEQDFAMRPALKELHGYQRDALTTALDGFDDRGGILEWGDVLSKATRGEPVGGQSVGEFIPWCYREVRPGRILTQQTEAYTRARQYYIAHWLLPAFNAAARDLSRRATEEPADSDRDSDGPGVTQV